MLLRAVAMPRAPLLIVVFVACPRRGWRRVVGPGMLTLFASACGGAQLAPEDPHPPTRMATGDPNVRQLVLEMAEKKTCSQLEGKWLGLPAQDDTPSGCPKNLTGADAGLACSWGRLQIRDCKAHIDKDALSLSFGGVGWTWVDQKSGSVGVRQYVYLTASVEMKSALDIGYDTSSKIASRWLMPDAAAARPGNALGTIKAPPPTVRPPSVPSPRRPRRLRSRSTRDRSAPRDREGAQCSKRSSARGTPGTTF